jgi:hypothetical protein
MTDTIAVSVLKYKKCTFRLFVGLGAGFWDGLFQPIMVGVTRPYGIYVDGLKLQLKCKFCW